MRIVHVSNFSTKGNNGRFYAVENKLNNGFARLGHDVVSFSDRAAARSGFLGIRELGRGRANRQLIELCRECRPDLLVLGHASLISTETLKVIRAALSDIRIAHWTCDSLFHTPKNMALLQSLSPLVDATFVTTAGDVLREVIVSGGRATYMPNPVDDSIETERAFERTELPVDLFFAGSADPERTEICNRVRSALPDLHFEIRGMLGGPPVQGAELIAMLGHSRMGLALSRPNNAFLYASNRIAQLMGNGVLAFVDKRSGFDSMFSPEELVTYDGIDHLIERLRFFSENDDQRRAVAERGWRRVHSSHSVTQVAAWIIEVTFHAPSSQAYAWPATVYEQQSG